VSQRNGANKRAQTFGFNKLAQTNKCNQTCANSFTALDRAVVDLYVRFVTVVVVSGHQTSQLDVVLSSNPVKLWARKLLPHVALVGTFVSGWNDRGKRGGKVLAAARFWWTTELAGNIFSSRDFCNKCSVLSVARLVRDNCG